MRQRRLFQWVILASSLVALVYIWATSSPPAMTAEQQRVKVIVSFYQPPGPPEEQPIRDLGGTIRHRYQFAPSLAALMPQANLDALRADPRVEAVEMDAYAAVTAP